MTEASSERKELKANWKTEVEVPLLSLDDVKKHNTKNDLWMVIHGGGEHAQIDLQLVTILTERSVYNVTEYARDHPGGPDALMEVAGTDATSAYEDVSIT
jgi:cytochrome-b5 reductase